MTQSSIDFPCILQPEDNGLLFIRPYRFAGLLAGYPCQGLFNYINSRFSQFRWTADRLNL